MPVRRPMCAASPNGAPRGDTAIPWHDRDGRGPVTGARCEFVSQDGEIERWLESGTPVTPRLAARWFQALYETPLMFSGILDADGRVLDANQLSIEGCGFDRADIIGTP